MWRVITSTLFLTCINANLVYSSYPPYIVDERYNSPNSVNSGNMDGRLHVPGMTSYPQYITHTNHPQSVTQQFNYQPKRFPNTYQQQLADPLYRTKNNARPVGYYLRTNNNNLRHSQVPPKGLYQGNEAFPFDTDYGSTGVSDLNFSDPDLIPLIEPRVADAPSYNEDLELTEGFGNYLKRRTLIDPQASTSINDAAHQYNALLAVLIALARVIRNSCADFEQVYDQLYFQTVDTYYRYGVANAEKVAAMIEDYIQKGNSHMPKIKKLKQEICEKELFCSASVDNHIKSSQLLYVKELETLEALAHLARSYYPYIEEFDQAAQKGTVLPYLQRSKERLKEYIMHVINSVEHLTDRQVRC